MAVLLTPYHGVLSTLVDTKDIESSVLDYLSQHQPDINPIMGVNHEYKLIPIIDNKKTKEIPLFNHPLIISNKKNNYLAYDVRNNIKVKEDALGYESYKIRYMQDYIFTTLRTVLTLKWLEEKRERFNKNYSYPGLIFASWLGDTIMTRYGLNFQAKIDITILAHHYWQTLFNDGSLDNTLVGVYTASLTRFNENYVIKLLGNIGKNDTLDQLVENIKQVVSDRRIDSLNSTVIQTVITNSWVGNNARELCVVALDHPPTFMTMVYLALTEKSTKNSLISRLTTKYTKPGKEQYERDMTDIVKTSIIFDF